MSEQIETSVAAEAPEPSTNPAFLVRVQRILSDHRFLKAALLLLLATSTLAMFSFTGSAFKTNQLLTASDETIEAILSAEAQPTRNAAYHEFLAERAAALEIPDIFSAKLNVRKALEINPHNPYAWAHLAYLITFTEEAVTPEAIEALKQSIYHCLYCDIELSKWRLEYMLANWQQLPDEIHAEARHHATLLKAYPGEHAYLRDKIIRARPNDIELGVQTQELNADE